jgi:ribosomal peptide maturation radical SAM protein 1
MGGSNCDSPMGEEYARNVDVVDYVFSGPALVNFPKFVGHLLDGETEECGRLKGVFSRHLTDRASNERAGEELDINVDCDLDYSEFFDSFERRFASSGAEPQVHLETSRGCWWGEKSHCTFCGLNADSMFYRAMAPDKAVKLFQDLIRRYRDKASIFFAVDNIIPKNYFTEVLPRIGAPAGTKLFYEVKANLSDAEVKALADAGVRWIQPGIEALSTTSLKLMKKGASAFVNLRLLKNCLRHGLDPSWNLLVGFPGESAEVYAKYVKDLPLTTHLRPPQGVAIIHFDRYSPYHFRAAEYGLKLKPVEYYEYCFPFPKASIENLAYYFVDTNFEAPHYKAIGQWVGAMRERIKFWRDRWGLSTHDSWERVKDDPHAPKLELRRQGSGGRIWDSRGTDPVEFEVSPVQVQLLEFLDNDRNDRSLREFAESLQIDLVTEMALLDERRLIFHEDDRAMSLVVLPHR